MAEREAAVRDRERLFDTLERTARDRGQSIKACAATLGVGYSTYLAIKAGTKPLSAHSTFVRRVAEYLEWPLMDVLLLGRVFTLEDFSYKGSLQEQVDLAYFRMIDDRRVRAVMPTVKEWAKTPTASKLTIVALYHALFMKRFAAEFDDNQRRAWEALLAPLFEPSEIKQEPPRLRRASGSK